jgi:hypothetical protein
MTNHELEELTEGAKRVLESSTDPATVRWANSVIRFGEIILKEREEMAELRLERNDLLRERAKWSEMIGSLEARMKDLQNAHAEQTDLLQGQIETLRQRIKANQDAQNELVASLQRQLKASKG